MRWNRTGTRSQRGASMTEFVIVAPVLLLVGLGTVQAGLLYHAKSTVNYATFEAARAGATRNARPGPMKRELGARLAPLQGGDGSMQMAARAIGRSIAEVSADAGLDGAPSTRLEILSPTTEAFDAWGEPSLEHVGREAIPNSHLRHRGSEEVNGLTLQEANLLTIEVRHGVELKVPMVSTIIARTMERIDPENAAYYAANRMPIESLATVRMQSEAWRDTTLAGGIPNLPGTPGSPVAGGGPGSGNCRQNGLPVNSPVIASRDRSAPGACSADSNAAGGGNRGTGSAASGAGNCAASAGGRSAGGGTSSRGITRGSGGSNGTAGRSGANGSSSGGGRDRSGPVASTSNEPRRDRRGNLIGDPAVGEQRPDGLPARRGNEPPPNLAPTGARWRGAFRAAKRGSGIPMSQQPAEVRPNIDRQGRQQKGKVYVFIVGGREVTIRDDAGGHDFGTNDPQNRGPHFNDESGGHYDYS